jgi:hypothetical protein
MPGTQRMMSSNMLVGIPTENLNVLATNIVRFLPLRSHYQAKKNPIVLA